MHTYYGDFSGGFSIYFRLCVCALYLRCVYDFRTKCCHTKYIYSYASDFTSFQGIMSTGIFVLAHSLFRLQYCDFSNHSSIFRCHISLRDDHRLRLPASRGERGYGCSVGYWIDHPSVPVDGWDGGSLVCTRCCDWKQTIVCDGASDRNGRW